jgi:alpha-tubulin suppressor-like RCC1 family protein
MEFSGVDSEEEANAISGSPMLGSVLVASKGQWLGYPLPEVSYSYWFRCDLSHTTASTSQPVDCEGIPGSNGANGETYLVSTQDVGKYLAFGVIAVNSSGTIRYFTPTTNSVVAIPTLLNPPVLSGTPRYGQNLSVTDGRWSVAGGISMSFGYQWFRCDSGSPVISDGRPDNCSQASGQTGSSYALSEADLGKFIVASVTATNSFNESVVAASNVSTQILSTPTLVTAPTVSGTRLTGNDLSVSAGSWAVYPAVVPTYQWYRCSSSVASVVTTLPSQCSAIDGATLSTYSLVADDAGKFVTVATSKSNDLGSLSVWSVTNQVPVSTSNPLITGILKVGELISATPGSWMSYPTANSTYQWYRCDSAVSSDVTTLPAQCSAIDGATESTYSLVADDAWKFVTVAVSKTNASGSQTWWAESKTVVTREVKEMATGQATCALFEGGLVKCWGQNAHGEVGDGTTVDRLTPVDVADLENVESISAGPVTCAVLTSGSLNCWGRNYTGQLGDGTEIGERLRPASVSGLSNVVSVSVGDNHSCVVLADTSVKCWGSNGYGQLGDGSNVDRLTPVTVSGLTNVVSLAMGNSHSCAMLADGSAKCWGSNNNGQLGEGSADNSYSLTPVTVSGLSNVVSISAGDRHSCASLAEGSVKCWGDNYYGQLGRGEPGSWDHYSPVPVLGIADAVMVAADAGYSCAVLANGTSKCWGDNRFGNVGIGNFGAYNTPQDVLGIASAKSISAGPVTCVVLTEGSVMCWGGPRVGDGTTTYHSRPVSVGFQ